MEARAKRAFYFLVSQIKLAVSNLMSCDNVKLCMQITPIAFTRGNFHVTFKSKVKTDILHCQIVSKCTYHCVSCNSM